MSSYPGKAAWLGSVESDETSGGHTGKGVGVGWGAKAKEMPLLSDSCVCCLNVFLIPLVPGDEKEGKRH